MERQFAYIRLTYLIDRGVRGRYRARVLGSRPGSAPNYSLRCRFPPWNWKTSCSKSGPSPARGPGRARKRAAERIRREAVWRGIPRSELRDALQRSLA